MLAILVSMRLFSMEPEKTIKITGAIVAPWVKGNLCIGFWYNQEKIRVCKPIQASQDYTFEIPQRIDHVKVYRSFDKECKVVKNGKKKCHAIKGRFNTKNNFNELNLTYDHNNILNFYTIPPKEPESIYGYPLKNPSPIFRDTEMSNPEAFS